MDSRPDLKVSVSGVRGIVGRSFTPELVRRFAQTFTGFLEGKKVLLARDSRPTGSFYLDLLAKQLTSAGYQVIELGICPTPVLLWSVRFLRADGGIMLTASHNPSEWNGLKFVGADGQFLDEEKMDRIHQQVLSGKFSHPRSLRGFRKKNPTVLRYYLNTLLHSIDQAAIRRRRFHVAIDPCNGAGAVLTPLFLKKLGCRVETINGKANGRFAHPPEPTPSHLSRLSRLVKKTGAHIGFAQDPDADRLAVVTEEGVALNGEYTLALAVQEVLSHERGPVVVNLSTSNMTQELAFRAGVSFSRTRIGERHVVERMMKVGAVVGGEGNGGVIYPRINPARDSFVGMALLLQHLASGARLSQWLRSLPSYVMLQEKLPLRKLFSLQKLGRRLRQRYPKGRFDWQDGVRLQLAGGWIHVRPSNTEPLVRVVVEDKTEEKARGLLKEVLSYLT